MTLFDQLTLLATGLVAIYLLWFFYKSHQERKGAHNLYYMISFGVLLVSGLLLIWLGYGILSNPLVVIVAAIIPIFLSLGLVTEFAPKYEKHYLLFAILGLLIISITRYVGPELGRTISLATIHSIAALFVLLTPIYAIKKGKATGSFAFVTIGGLLISVGGISLAFLKVGLPILSADVIFTILAPVLFLMSLSYAYGFTKQKPKETKTSVSA